MTSVIMTISETKICHSSSFAVLLLLPFHYVYDSGGKDCHDATLPSTILA
jgi:hypothetical protein